MRRAHRTRPGSNHAGGGDEDPSSSPDSRGDRSRPQNPGALPADLTAIAEAAQAARHLQLRGLMTVAPIVSDPEQVRPVFRRLRALRDETSQRLATPLPVLSMGMTEDYRVAVEEGATMLRLGRALFGPR